MRQYRSAAWIMAALLLCQPLATEAAVFSVGTQNSYTSSASYPGGAKLDSTHVIVAYNSGGTGKAAIVTVDGTTTSFGSEYQFCSSSCSSINVAMLDSTHAIIIYESGGSGYAVIATISGSAISYGTATSFASSLRTGNQTMAVTAMDSTHVAVAYVTQSGMSSFATSVIAATVSGSSMTFGSATTLSGASGQYVALAAMDATHFIASYNTSGGTPYIIAASVSGTTMSLGSAVTFDDYCCDPSISKLSSTRAVVAFRSDSTDYPTAFIATLSGTSISAGSNQNILSVRAYFPLAVPLDATHLVLMFRNQEDDNRSTYALEMTVSGSTITGDSETLALSTTLANLNRTIVQLDSASALLLANNKAAVVTTDTTGPAAPSSFSLSADTSGVDLSWSNPVDSDFSSVTIRRSTSTYPSSSTGGTAVASGVTDSSTSESGLSEGRHYYSIFARDLRGNYSRAATGSVVVDLTPPARPGRFLANAEGSNIMLSWTNPEDSDFASVTIRRSDTSSPSSVTDGTAVVTGSAGTSYADSSLAPGTYYYSIFSKDTTGHYASPAYASATIAASTSTSTESQGGGGGRGGGGGGGSTGGSRSGGGDTGSRSAPAATGQTSVFRSAAAPVASPSTPSPSPSPSTQSPSAPATPSQSPAAVTAETARQLDNVFQRLEARVEKQIAMNPKAAPMLRKMLTRMNARIAKLKGRSAGR